MSHKIRKITDYINFGIFRFKQFRMLKELEKYIKKKSSYLKVVRISDRGIGKSFTLVQLSEKYDIPIFVRFNHTREHLNYMSRKLYGHDANVIVVNDACNGLRFDVGLIEEGFDILEISKLREFVNCLVGFRR